jgi:hypothetical protein
MSIVSDPVSRDSSEPRPRPVVPLPKPKPRKPATEVHGVCRWIELPLPIADFESGILAITVTPARGKPVTEEYVVTLPADRSGARLTKPDGTQYFVDLANGGLCDCKDREYRPERPGGCKHLRAVIVAVAALPQKQKHAACPVCCECVDAPGLCENCTAEEEAFAAHHQVEEMQAGGIDPWDCPEAEERYEPTDEPP